MIVMLELGFATCWGEEIFHASLWLGNLNERDRFEDLDTVWRIILKLILWRLHWSVWD